MTTVADTASAFSHFMSILFDPTDLVEMRLLPSGRKLFAVAREWSDKFGELVFANTDGAQDVYAGINPRIREGGREEDVALARCLFADWDDVDPAQAQSLISSKKLPQPNLIVHSGHGIHGYWKLIDPVTDMAAWRRAMERLIVKAGSDAKIKDPPRIMRVPGLLNLPDARKGEDTPVPVTIISANVESLYHLEEIAGPDEGRRPQLPAPTSVLPANPRDRYARLSRATMQFIINGAPDGERQTNCYNAACDMAGNGFSHAETEAKLLPAAIACGCAESKARQGIRSAYSHPRSPSIPFGAADGFPAPASTTVTVAVAVAIPESIAATPAPAAASSPAQPTLNVDRHLISNVIDTTFRDSDGEDVPCRYYIPIPAIHSAIVEAMGSWPRRAGGMLFFAKPANGQAIPDTGDIQWITDVDSLFAWIGESCDVRWTTQEALHHRTKRKLNPPTKREFFSFVASRAEPSYRAVSALPHWPAVEGLYYLQCNLPPVPVPDGNSQTPLGTLVNKFNPETPEDRLLMLAALLTPGWGGPPGARPAFVFTSEHGRGVGKTATANVLAKIWGGATTIGTKEDWDKVRGRLLSESSLAQRIVIIDNIKGRLHGSDIEGLITADQIDGWKPYHGQATRPNLITWFMTSNSPSLSRDLADRSVVVKVGPSKHGFNFIEWADKWIDQHQAEIIAELLEILRGEPLCAIDTANRDRWGSWQDAILTRFDDGNELAMTINNRRPAVDADLDDAEEIAHAIIAMVSEKYFDHSHRVIRIGRDQLQRQLISRSIVDKSMTARAVTSFVKDKIGTGSLSFLRYKSGRQDGAADHYWFYIGEHANGDTEVVDLDPGAAQ